MPTVRIRALSATEAEIAAPRMEARARHVARRDRANADIAAEDTGIAALAALIDPLATGVERDEDGTLYLTRQVL